MQRKEDVEGLVKEGSYLDVLSTVLPSEPLHRQVPSRAAVDH